MAKTGINFERCNVGSVELHNDRAPEYLESIKHSGRELYIFEDKQHLNQSWVNPTYEGTTCAEIFEKQKARYKEKVGQEPNLEDRIRTDKKTGKQITVAGWSPIREGVCPIKEDTKLEDFKPFIDWCSANGLTVIRIDLHFDEGYQDEKAERKYNRHAHIVVDWLNWQTAKTAKLGKDKMSEAQDVIAISLGMERGEKKIETGKEHLSPTEQREKKAEEHYRELVKEIEELQKTKTGIVAKIEDSWKYKSAAEEGEKKMKQFLAHFERFRKEYEELVGNLKKKLSEAEKEARTLYDEKEKYRKECNRLNIAVKHWIDEARKGQQAKSKSLKQ